MRMRDVCACVTRGCTRYATHASCTPARPARATAWLSCYCVTYSFRPARAIALLTAAFVFGPTTLWTLYMCVFVCVCVCVCRARALSFSLSLSRARVLSLCVRVSLCATTHALYDESAGKGPGPVRLMLGVLCRGCVGRCGFDCSQLQLARSRHGRVPRLLRDGGWSGQPAVCPVVCAAFSLPGPTFCWCCCALVL